MIKGERGDRNCQFPALIYPQILLKRHKNIQAQNAELLHKAKVFQEELTELLTRAPIPRQAEVMKLIKELQEKVINLEIETLATERMESLQQELILFKDNALAEIADRVQDVVASKIRLSDLTQKTIENFSTLEQETAQKIKQMKENLEHVCCDMTSNIIGGKEKVKFYADRLEEMYNQLKAFGQSQLKKAKHLESEAFSAIQIWKRNKSVDFASMRESVLMIQKSKQELSQKIPRLIDEFEASLKIFQAQLQAAMKEKYRQQIEEIGRAEMQLVYSRLHQEVNEKEVLSSEKQKGKPSKN